MIKPYSIIGNQGTALVITLLIIATLTGLAVAFSEESSVELNLAGYTRDSYRAYQIAHSGVDIALFLLDLDEDRDMDSLSEEWSQFGAESYPEGLPIEVSVLGRIKDENSKINLNTLINSKGEIEDKRKKQLLRLFTVLGLREELANPILDWLDPDDIERMEGAEAYYYQAMDEPYECFNGPFLTLGQIFLVKGVGKISHFGEDGEMRLMDFITIHSDGMININTAPREILESLDEGLDSTIAQTIIDYRNEENFLEIDDLKKVAGMDNELFNRIAPWITVKSSAFTIDLKVSCHEAVAQVKAVAVRRGDKSQLTYCQVM